MSMVARTPVFGSAVCPHAYAKAADPRTGSPRYSGYEAPRKDRLGIGDTVEHTSNHRRDFRG
jgi:hypothetical protein